MSLSETPEYVYVHVTNEYITQITLKKIASGSFLKKQQLAWLKVVKMKNIMQRLEVEMKSEVQFEGLSCNMEVKTMEDQ